MSDKRDRDGPESAAKRGMKIPALTLKNFGPWSKGVRHVNTENGDSNVELHNRKKMDYKVPRRTENVDDEVEDDDGVVTTTRRAWSNVRDQKGLDTRQNQYDKMEADLKLARGKCWTLISQTVTPALLHACESDPGFKQLQADKDSLGFYLLQEKICLKQSKRNSEAIRSKWVRHTYLEDEDIYEFLNIFEEFVREIRLSSGSETAVRDVDMTQRLREALPQELAKDAMKDTFLLDQDDPLYPPYEVCKKRLITLVESNNIKKEDDNLNESRSPRRQALLFKKDGGVDRGKFVPKRDREGKPYVKKGQFQKKCFNCKSTTHLKDQCPKQPRKDSEKCDICHMLNHKTSDCRFDITSKNCYPDVLAESKLNKGKTEHARKGRPPKGGTAYMVSAEQEEENNDIQGNYIVRSGTAYSAQAEGEQAEMSSYSADSDTQSNSTVDGDDAHSDCKDRPLDCTEERLVDAAVGISSTHDASYEEKLNIQAVEDFEYREAAAHKADAALKREIAEDSRTFYARMAQQTRDSEAEAEQQKIRAAVKEAGEAYETRHRAATYTDCERIVNSLGDDSWPKRYIDELVGHRHKAMRREMMIRRRDAD
jgi:hypothetical protein